MRRLVPKIAWWRIAMVGAHELNAMAEKLGPVTSRRGEVAVLFERRGEPRWSLNRWRLNRDEAGSEQITVLRKLGQGELWWSLVRELTSGDHDVEMKARLRMETSEFEAEAEDKDDEPCLSTLGFVATYHSEEGMR
ncbi:hypothetical protein Bca4012_037777 [Brassica carinata]